MSRAAGIFLIVAGLVLAAWQFHQYGISGEEVTRVRLDGMTGSSTAVRLDRSMNPLRLVMRGQYDIQLERHQVTAFSYDVNLTGPGGITIFENTGTVYPPLEPEASVISNETAFVALGSFNVAEDGGYFIDWRIHADKATIRELTLSVRRNASAVSYFYAALAGGMFFIGLALAAFARRR